MNKTIRVHWLEDNPSPGHCGVTWTVCWPSGEFLKTDSVVVHSEDGNQSIAAQAWPLGYWPDGSVKWLALAAVIDPCQHRVLQVGKGKGIPPPSGIQCSSEDRQIHVDTGSMQCVIATDGDVAIRSITTEGREVCRNVQLVCRRQRQEDDNQEERISRQELLGTLDRATLEQAGPVRTVVKLEGTHRRGEGDSFLPFVVRLYFYAGQSSIRVTHTMTYDGDASKDFIGALALRVTVPLRQKPHRRQVWFAADDGVWQEPVQLAPPFSAERPLQLSGQPFADPTGVEAMPLWDRFEILQDSSDHFHVRKSCGKEFCWVTAMQGRRSPGTAVVCDESGGMAVSLRDFWQAYPSALSIDNAGRSNDATLTAWMWPMDVEAADLRHYSDRMHGPVYECHKCLQLEAGPINPRFSNAYGIARTSELTLWALSRSVNRGEVVAMAGIASRSPVLVCDVAHYQRSGVFGVWSAPDASSPVKQTLEAKLSELLDFYLAEVEQSHFYGFWNYGDVMHTYDAHRHCWRYDEGGWAWDNTECGTEPWLWYSFLRTGRADVFRLAEAMTRHVSDVDTHHAGLHEGLGSRHNVTHWGCLAKEPRISMAGGKRFYHFLVADDRCGDIMTEVLEHYPWGRFSDYRGPQNIQTGPSWGALCWNWVTAWERTGDTRYRDKLLRGIEGILAQKPPLINGLTFRFDPDKSTLEFVGGNQFSHHMAMGFGAPEIWMEMADLLDHDAWREALAGYGEYWALSSKEREALPHDGYVGFDDPELNVFMVRSSAYAAARRHNTSLARKTWDVLLKDGMHVETNRDPNTGRTLRELAGETFPAGWGHTNRAAQWSLNTIESLALIGEYLE